MMIRKWGRRLARALVAMGLLAGLAGCWDTRPVDERALVLLLAVAPGPKPGSLEVYFQTPTPAALANTKGASKASNEVYTLTGVAPTLWAAFTVAEAKSSRDLYLGQLQAVVLSTRLSPTQMKGVLLSMARLASLSKTPFVLATSDGVKTVMSGKTSQNPFPGLYVDQFFSCSKCQPVAMGMRLWQVNSREDNPGVDVILPEIAFRKKQFQIDRLALYRGHRFVGSLDPRQSQLLSVLAGRFSKIPLQVAPYHASLFSIRGSTRMSTSVVHGQIYAQFEVTAHAGLENVDTHTVDNAQMAVIARAAAQTLAGQLTGVLADTQKYDVDPLGVGRELSWQHPDAFAAIPHWHRFYPRVHFRVHVRVLVKDVGTVQ